MTLDSAIKSKEAERLQLQGDIERFLSAKGQVEVLGNTPFRKPEMLSVKEAVAASAANRFNK